MKVRLSAVCLLAVVLGSISFTAKADNSLASRPVSQLPVANQSFVHDLANPSSAPTDLVSLSQKISQSVVTVVCGNSLGTGWAIKVKLTDDMLASGYRSYLITNHHVVSSCLNGQTLNITLADKSQVTGKVWAWDSNDDVVGIVTSADIPPLTWQGATPLQGMWVGVIGSPLGFAGILTTGITSSVTLDPTIGTLTAPINHGNSGGPVFDREGTVIGFATAKYTNSEGFGIFYGTPLICRAVLACPLGTNAWYNNTLGAEVLMGNPIHISDGSIKFTAPTEPANIAGVLSCYTALNILDSQVETFKITGTYWRLTDLTDNKELARFSVPLDPLGNEKSVTTKYESGNLVAVAQRYGPPLLQFVMKNQVLGHQYECAIAVVALGTNGEFSTALATAEVTTLDFKPVPVVVAPTPTPTPTPSPTPTPTPTKKALPKTLTWTCTKGKSVLKFKGAVALCPNGYKLKK